MKVAVIVTDAAQAANVSGGVCEQTYRAFELPDCIADYIRSARKSQYANISLVVEAEPQP